MVQEQPPVWARGSSHLTPCGRRRLSPPLPCPMLAPRGRVPLDQMGMAQLSRIKPRQQQVLNAQEQHNTLAFREVCCDTFLKGLGRGQVVSSRKSLKQF